jgi:hypothetical protein
MTNTEDGLYTGAATQVFSYNFEEPLVWFDLSTVFGAPFEGKKITVTSEGSEGIEWPAGTNPGGSQVKVGDSEKDVVFTACA